MLFCSLPLAANFRFSNTVYWALQSHTEWKFGREQNDGLQTTILRQGKKKKKKSTSTEKRQCEIVSLMSSWGYRHFKSQTSVVRQHMLCFAIHSVCGLNCSSLGEEQVAVGKKPKIHKRLRGNLPELSIAISHVLVSYMKKILKFQIV